MREMIKYGKNITYRTADKNLLESLYDPSIQDKLGELIKTKRLEIGMSQIELGEATGIDHKYIQRFEKGRENTSIKRLFVMLKALGVKIQVGKQVLGG